MYVDLSWCVCVVSGWFIEEMFVFASVCVYVGVRACVNVYVCVFV